MKSSARRLFTQTAVLAAVILCAAGLQAWAFTEPNGTPPLADVSAPINVGATSQDKSGGGNAWITADGLGSRYGALLATVSGSVSIGTTSNAGTLNVASPTGGTATICLNGTCSASVGSSGPAGGATSGMQFELLMNSGTWNPPASGVTYNYIITCIGGGGGSGGTAGVANYNGGYWGGGNGADGGTTSFGTLCTAGGGTHSNAKNGNGNNSCYSTGDCSGGSGGNGGFGGGGGTSLGNTQPGSGGTGLDFTGGGMGYGYQGISGQSNGGPYIEPGTEYAPNGYEYAGTWPNGGLPAIGSTGGGGGGGDPLLLFQWVGATGCGRGGNGAGMVSGWSGASGGGGSGRMATVSGTFSGSQTVTIGAGGSAGAGGTASNPVGAPAGNSGNPGHSGCIGIWYWPVR